MKKFIATTIAAATVFASIPAASANEEIPPAEVHNVAPTTNNVDPWTILPILRDTLIHGNPGLVCDLILYLISSGQLGFGPGYKFAETPITSLSS